MTHRHIDLGPLSRRARRETFSSRRRRGLPRLDSPHHVEELQHEVAPATAGEARRLDPRTGRPLHGDAEAVAALSDRELQRELTIAALTSSRNDRFERLLAERQRRRSRPNPRWKQVLVSFATPTDRD